MKEQNKDSGLETKTFPRSQVFTTEEDPRDGLSKEQLQAKIDAVYQRLADKVLKKKLLTA